MSAGGESAVRAVVLISGEGTNLQAFIDAVAAGDLPLGLAAVVASRADAPGLARARRAGITAAAVPADDAPDREAYDAALAAEIRRHDPQLVLLAGFMRILGSAFVQEFAGRLLNVHPSLLPAYRGLHTHRRVLAAGDPTHGCTVHFVSDELDGGPAVIQARVPVLPGDDEASLSARVQAAEHIIYPRAAGWFASGRLRLAGGVPELDGSALHEPVVLDL
ncbi:phosphoribosylglycinamide formyltransferase [Lentisalinibacter orientalis]|uniref:phosphoribosylglycinamide formyltransferase n=1 Tax=Lentisalinibacter orientalis TaxID=2992241 RepID=UPI00386E975A